MRGGTIRSPRSVRQNGWSCFGRAPLSQARPGCFPILCSRTPSLGIGCSLDSILVGFVCSESKVISSRRELFGIEWAKRIGARVRRLPKRVGVSRERRSISTSVRPRCRLRSFWTPRYDSARSGTRSLDRRLEESGRLESERFRLKEANERLAKLLQYRRFV